MRRAPTGRENLWQLKELYPVRLRALGLVERMASWNDPADQRSSEMAFAYSDMLETIKNKQRALADIDWDASGAGVDHRRTASTTQAIHASDVVWIEYRSARLCCDGPGGALAALGTFTAAESSAASELAPIAS